MLGYELKYLLANNINSLRFSLRYVNYLLVPQTDWHAQVS